MLAVKEGDDEIKRGRQEKSLFADVLRILKAEERLPGILDREDIDVPEFREIHEKASA
jgi:hypothetical protein